MNCPFCKRDPYHWEDVGVCYVPVAIVCCEPMIALSEGCKKAKQALRFMRSYSPKKKARAKRLLRELNGWED